MDDKLSIIDLQARLDLVAPVAERIWNEWLRARGKPLDDAIKKFSRITESENEFTLVALQGGCFAGTVSFVKADHPDRPAIGPWIAAVYVEPICRGQGIATQLIKAAEGMAWVRGVGEIFLHCSADMRPFYAGLGYCEVESKVGAYETYIFRKLRS